MLVRRSSRQGYLESALGLMTLTIGAGGTGSSIKNGRIAHPRFDRMRDQAPALERRSHSSKPMRPRRVALYAELNGKGAPVTVFLYKEGNGSHDHTISRL
jgi:hypothetical protein